MEPPTGKDSLKGTVAESLLSPAKMKLLSLCLGLTLVWAHVEGHHEVVTSNFDLSKVELVEHSDV